MRPSSGGTCGATDALELLRPTGRYAEPQFSPIFVDEPSFTISVKAPGMNQLIWSLAPHGHLGADWRAHIEKQPENGFCRSGCRGGTR